MQTPSLHRAVGVFENQRKVVEAARALLAKGIPGERMLLAARDWREQELETLGIKMQKAASSGAATGAAVGVGVGAAAGLLTLLIPGIGLAAAGLAVLATATGAAAGGWVGAFAGMEFSEAEARDYAAHVESGHTVLVVRDEDRRDEARAVMVEHGAYDFSMSTN